MWRYALIFAAALSGCAAALYVAVHRYEWLGPLVANSLRSVFGTGFVAKLEDLVYGVEDRVNRWTKRDQAPKAYWSVPTNTAHAPPTTPSAGNPASGAPRAPELVETGPPPFHPVDPGPVLKRWSAQGDGVWVPIVDPRRPDEAPYMYKTLLHPDATRSWAEVFVVAIDVPRVDLFVVAGSQEPKTDDPKTASYVRVAKVPEAQHEELLAAFNGGFMTEHGGYGMKVDGVVLVQPKPKA
ncbi:MAG TPA: hypothetical protein VFQ35_20005, partial [Polyangiaceae bacterium]|nr:hypothetical protein [Polyangiaceae bacterium]